MTPQIMLVINDEWHMKNMMNDPVAKVGAKRGRP